MKLVIVSGLSGAGKTVALKQFEDHGYYCIDNLPLALVLPLAERALKGEAEKRGSPVDFCAAEPAAMGEPRSGERHAMDGGAGLTGGAGLRSQTGSRGPEARAGSGALSGSSRYERLAVGIDARESASEIASFPHYMEQLRGQGIEVQVLFLTASDDTLLHRFSETRRTHPLTSAALPLSEAIPRERALLRPVADGADHTLDTSDYNLHELREAIRAHMPGAERGKLGLTLESFGYKNGVPEGADFVFDVRCLPNPHWEPALRGLTGRDPEVITFLERAEDTGLILRDIEQFLQRWLPRFQEQDRAYVTIALGCTGGQHRSVYLAERLADRLRRHYDPVIVRHRELL